MDRSFWMEHISWRLRLTLLLVAIMFGMATSVSWLVVSDAPQAFATAAADDEDEDDEGDDDEDEDEDDDDDEEAHELEGSVLRIDRGKNPPEVIVGTLDGEVLVRMHKTDELDIHGVREGDYVSIDGEKVHELLFEGTNIEVKRRADR
jgi:hypothetical protein